MKVEKILYQGKSPYQEVLVFEVILDLLIVCMYVGLSLSDIVMYNVLHCVCSLQPMGMSLCLMELFN